MSRLDTMARFADPNFPPIPDLTGQTARIALSDVFICGGICTVYEATVTIVGTGFSFTANGGGFGLKGLTTGPRFLMPASRGTATQSVGTADVLNHGDGMANGVGGPGAVSSPGTAGTSGSNAVCVIDY